MARPKLRVLPNPSKACREYRGIAHDVRLLDKTLATGGELEVTGLVYLPQILAIHRFCSPRESRQDRLANQAGFLWGLSADGLAELIRSRA